jgi:3-hydroxybutyryl-CoA dehydrogenase
VIEAVFEDLELKQSIFQKLDELSPPHTILASNTSSLMPSLLAAATSRPDRVLVTHYFNPPYLLPLVEIVPGPDTSDRTVSVVRDLLLKVGKRPAIVQKEVPGFIGNRLQAALVREAIYLMDRGVATPKDIDTVIKNGFGRRLATAGIFEVCEMAGWDLVLAVSKYLTPHLESSREPSPLLRQRVEQGKLGVKTGEGFYKWTPDSAEALRQRTARALIEIAKWD